MVETSLYEATVWTQASGHHAVTAWIICPCANDDATSCSPLPVIAFPVATATGWCSTCLPDAAYWSRLCKAIGLDNIIEDERFIDSQARYKNMTELIGILIRLWQPNPGTNGARFSMKPG